MRGNRHKNLLLKLSAFIMSLGILLSGCSMSDLKDLAASAGGQNTENVSIDSEKELDVHYIDVGQADCIFIDLPDGRNIMIDAGNRDDFDKIDSYLSELKVDSIDYMVLTHPHEDHIGSAAKVIEKYAPSKVYMPKSSANTKVFENTLNAISKSGAKMIPAAAGEYIIDEKNISMEILAPNGTGYDTQNNYSIVTKLIYNDCSFLFTGDAETISEDEILDAGFDVSADVLKVGHHGSTTSTSDEFLKAVSPKYAVIMCGVGNEYGHPHREILSKLQNSGIDIFRTDTQGDIVCRSDGENIAFGSQPASEGEENSQQFIGNKNSKVFHTPDCNNNMSEKNKVYFSSYEEAEEAGYTPCSNCKPKK